MAPILCAGVTTDKGIKETEAKPGEWIGAQRREARSQRNRECDLPSRLAEPLDFSNETRVQSLVLSRVQIASYIQP